MTDRRQSWQIGPRTSLPSFETIGYGEDEDADADAETQVSASYRESEFSAGKDVGNGSDAVYAVPHRKQVTSVFPVPHGKPRRAHVRCISVLSPCSQGKPPSALERS